MTQKLQAIATFFGVFNRHLGGGGGGGGGVAQLAENSSNNKYFYSDCRFWLISRFTGGQLLHCSRRESPGEVDGP